jgi:hypothetical protein
VDIRGHVDKGSAENNMNLNVSTTPTPVQSSVPGREPASPTRQHNEVAAQQSTPVSVKRSSAVEPIAVSEAFSLVTLEDSKAEQVMVTNIVSLWNSLERKSSSAQISKKSVADTKEDIAETKRALCVQLSAFKKLLAKVGRNGRWSQFLKEENMSKTTADRYVKWFDKMMEPTKLVPDELSTSANISQLVTSIAARILRTLNTATSITRFLEGLTDALHKANPQK